MISRALKSGLCGLSLLTLVGCHRTLPEPDTGDTPPDLPGDGDGDGDGNGSGDGDGDGDGDGCSSTEIECNGECINPLTDEQNCGTCGRTCEEKLGLLIEGGCSQGECLPMFSPCVSEADGFTTCDDVCAGQGEACLSEAESPYCHVVAMGWESDELEQCQVHDPGAAIGLGHIGCSDPLPFGGSCGFPDICTYFACCCSQTAQEP